MARRGRSRLSHSSRSILGPTNRASAGGRWLPLRKSARPSPPATGRQACPSSVRHCKRRSAMAGSRINHLRMVRRCAWSFPTSSARSLQRSPTSIAPARRSGRRRSATLRFHASAQRIHQIDDLCWRALFRRFNLLPGLLFLQQLLERIFVLIFELLRLEVARFGFHDVRGQLQHVLWNFFVGDIFEIFILFAYLVGIAQCNPEKALTARFECNDMLAGREDNPTECHHPFLADRLTNNSERLLANLAIGSEVIRAV